jgi:hypothetical protein
VAFPLPNSSQAAEQKVIVSLREASKGGASALYVHVVVRIVLRSEGCGNKGVSRVEQGEERAHCKIRGCRMGMGAVSGE